LHLGFDRSECPKRRTGRKLAGMLSSRPQGAERWPEGKKAMAASSAHTTSTTSERSENCSSIEFGQLFVSRRADR